ncbi:MAG: hypothetical protein ACRDJI_11660 [Actinomycetota bacterium]
MAVRAAVLVGGDLMARARLSEAAARADVELSAVGFGSMTDTLRVQKPDLVILDLDGGREAVLAELQAARAEGLVPERVLGYFSHVDSALSEAAMTAGCRAVPRGRFWSSLDELFGA